MHCLMTYKRQEPKTAFWGNQRDEEEEVGSSGGRHQVHRKADTEKSKKRFFSHTGQVHEGYLDETGRPSSKDISRGKIEKENLVFGQAATSKRGQPPSVTTPVKKEKKS